MLVSRTPHRADTVVFAAALAVATVHALDDAFVGRQPGVGLGQHAAAGLISVGVALVALALFTRSRPGVRSALAVGLGIPALANGAMHVIHIHFDAASGSDLSGVLAAVGGLVLVGLGATIPWRHRREAASSTPRRRWVARAAALPGALLVCLLAIVPVTFAVIETHKPRELVGSPPAGFANVAFDAADGLRLRGWYRPSRNGATILVVHGGGGDRNGAVRQARMLERHGYGVLLYDSRGRGESEGSPNSYGWGWEKDAAGALDFLARQPGVVAGRIGALGLSSGGDTVIDVAATRDDVSAAVADGAVLRTFEDTTRRQGFYAEALTSWLMFQAVRVFSGAAPPEPLEDLVAQISSPLLLISAGSAHERDANVAFAKVARAPVEHWNVPGAKHTGAARSHAAQYERRITTFFDGALLGR